VVIRDNELRPTGASGLGAGLGIRLTDREHSSSRWYPSEARVERFAVVDNIGAGDAALSTTVTAGGVFAAAPMFNNTDGVTMINGTIAGNRADAAPGLWGSSQFFGSFLTIVDNLIPVGAAPSLSARSGVYLGSNEHLLLGSIIAGNFDGTMPNNCDFPTGSLISAGYLMIGDATGCTVSGDTSSNMLGVDPLLGARQTSAEGMPYYRLAQNSLAANAIPRALCNDTRAFGVIGDAIGATRPQAGSPVGCEIGAIEGVAPSAALFSNGFE